MQWIRVYVSWQAVQPNQNDGYQWAEVDARLKAATDAHLSPIVTVINNPAWADQDGNHCGPLGDNQYLIDFYTALAERYSRSPYGVKYWEAGNEIDLTYHVWQRTYAPWGRIGCWGDLIPQYVEKLRLVWETVKVVDPDAVVLMGSLAMLNSTNMDFLNQVLATGGGPYFDGVGFSMYYGQDRAWYTCADPDRAKDHQCQSEMGMRGKSQIIQDILARHGVNKMILVTETASRCLHAYPRWEPCTEEELLSSAQYVIKSNVRALSSGARVVIWFTLDYPGFMYSSLLDENGDPKPSFEAYRVMAQELRWARYVRPMSLEELGDERLEGYLFTIGDRKRWVLWVNEATALPVPFKSLEQPDGMLRVVDLFGGEQLRTDTDDDLPSDETITLTVGESPVYVSQLP
jgi:hypothetical protein